MAEKRVRSKFHYGFYAAMKVFYDLDSVVKVYLTKSPYNRFVLLLHMKHSVWHILLLFHASVSASEMCSRFDNDSHIFLRHTFAALYDCSSAVLLLVTIIRTGIPNESIAICIFVFSTLLFATCPDFLQQLRQHFVTPARKPTVILCRPAFCPYTARQVRFYYVPCSVRNIMAM